MLNLKRLGGVQLFGFFLLCAMCIFFIVSFAVTRHQVTGALANLEEDNTQIKMIAAEQYLVQYLKNAEETAFLFAEHHIVSSTILGGTAAYDEVHDRLEVIKPVTGEHFIVLIDIEGNPIYQEVPLKEDQLKELVPLADNFTGNSRLSMFNYRSKPMLMVSVPVIYNGFQEGLLTYITGFDPERFFSPLQLRGSYWFGIRDREHSQVMNEPNDWITYVQSIERFGLDLVYAVNPTIFEKTQADFVQGLFFAVAASVIISYFFVYFIGRTLLVSPYKKLEHSEHLLEEKTQKLIEKEAQASRLARVAKHMLDAIVITDPAAKITWVNEAFERLSGYTLDEVKGRKPADFLQGPDTDKKVTRQIRLALNNQVPFETQLINYNKRGDSYWVEIAMVPLFNESGAGLEGFMAVERDISKQKHLQKSLQNSVMNAQSANIAKSQFLASMSHELRTPMNGVIGSAQLLTETQLNAEQRSFLKNLLDSSHHMMHLLNEILDFSKIEAGKLTLNLQPMNLAEFTAKLERSYKSMCAEKGLELSVHCNKNANAYYVVDEVRLTQIALNLLNNAWKFTLSGYIQLLVRYQSVNEKDYIEIEVIDTGIGIAEQRQKNIFEPFTQADGNTTRKFGGTGLGLAIIAKLVDAMEGSITLDSQPGEGSRFRVCIPVKKAEKVDISDDSEVKQFDGSGLRALIVEDSKVNYIVFEQYLIKRGFLCDIAENGQEGVKKALEGQYDLILMDNHMPILDGTEASKRIRAHDSAGGRPVIFACTADAFQENQQSMLEAGCDDLIIKPMQTNELDRLLHKWLGKNRGEQNIVPFSVRPN